MAAARELTTVGRLRNDPLRFLEALAHEEPIARRTIGKRPLLVALTPEAAREVLVTRQRELLKENVIDARRYGAVRWKPGLLTGNRVESHEQGRRLLRPDFSREQVAEHVGPIVAEETERLIGAWRAAGEAEAGGDLATLTLQVAARALFGETVPDERAVIDDMHTVLDAFRIAVSPATMLQDALRLRSGKRFIDAFTRLGQVSARLAAGAGPVARALREAGLDEEMRAAEVRGILLAGTETTAIAITWALTELVANPALAAEVVDEGEAAAERAFTETLRLYPPAWFIGRLAVTSTELVGEPVAEGSMVLVSPYLLHRDPRHFPEPRRFDPSRWAEGTTAAARAFTYVPFGSGPRRCIGEEVAWLEGRSILTSLIRAFAFELVGSPDLTPFAGASLRPAGKVRLALRPRSTARAGQLV